MFGRPQVKQFQESYRKVQDQKKIQDYFYFLKLVPHAFLDYIDNEEDYTYSYSLNHNKKTSDNSVMPTVAIILDYAPVKM
jgi:hypothetical protein